MKKVLLVGVGGYIGSSFKNYIKKYSEYDIHEVSSMNNDWDKIDFSGYDAVYNVSGLAHANARKGTDEQYYEVNGKLPVKVAQKAKNEGVPLFIQMSSMIVYGDMSPLFEDKTITADTVPSKPTVYGKSKMMAEEGLNKLADTSFKVAIIRPPLIYGENARDNFPKLVKFAKTFPIFPDLPNKQSMLYIDNLCELVHLIIEHCDGGIFYPQQREIIETSKLVKDISVACGKKIYLTKVFNPILGVLSKKISFIRKAFGSISYAQEISNHYDWEYCAVGYDESVKRVAHQNDDEN